MYDIMDMIHLILLLFCLCVCWTPCLVLNPTFHNSKISLLITGYVTGNYLILWKKSSLSLQSWKQAIAKWNPLSSTMSVTSMVISTIPFWNSCWSCKQVHLGNQTICPHWQWLKVANVFYDIVIDNSLYNVSIEQLCSAYQNHVLQNANYITFWTKAMEETTAPVAALAGMTNMMMINVVINPLVLALTTISLLIRVHQVAFLKVQHPILIALIMWNGIPIHQKTLTIPFI